MKKIIQIFILIFLCSFSNSYAASNIVFLNIEYAVNNSNIGKKLLSDLKKIQAEEINKLKIIEEDLKKKIMKLIKSKILYQKMS